MGNYAPFRNRLYLLLPGYSLWGWGCAWTRHYKITPSHYAFIFFRVSKHHLELWIWNKVTKEWILEYFYSYFFVSKFPTCIRYNQFHLCFIRRFLLFLTFFWIVHNEGDHIANYYSEIIAHSAFCILTHCRRCDALFFFITWHGHFELKRGEWF